MSVGQSVRQAGGRAGWLAGWKLLQYDTVRLKVEISVDKYEMCVYRYDRCPKQSLTFVHAMQPTSPVFI